jgi:hypothetical protein
MSRTLPVLFDLALFVCLFAAFEKTAYAYVDPGQGMLALQSLASAAAAAGYLLRRRLRKFFRRSTGADRSR